MVQLRVNANAAWVRLLGTARLKGVGVADAQELFTLNRTPLPRSLHMPRSAPCL